MSGVDFDSIDLNSLEVTCIRVISDIDNFKQKLKQACTIQKLDISVKYTLAVTLAALDPQWIKDQLIWSYYQWHTIDPGWHRKRKRNRQ